MEPVIIFDVAMKHFDWRPMEVSTALFIGGCLSTLRERLGLKWGHVGIKNVGSFLISFAVVTAGYVSTDWYVARRDHMRMLAKGNYEVAQGPVENFRPMYYEGRREESFTVEGRTFTYSDHVVTTCFNQPASHGGPVKPGMSLRIEFTGGCILRVEAR
jgi:hypothetical protein